ncbi:unnamed protein product, partial [Effrenium voratum]
PWIESHMRSHVSNFAEFFVLFLVHLHSALGQEWPNSFRGFANGRPGLLTGVGDSNFRYYYQLVAVDLLLIHHGFRQCEAFRWEDSMDGLQDAIEAFQRSSGLAADAQQLSASFWQQLVVPVKPGDSTAAALALRWLLRSTSKASRPPLWDDVEV